MLGIRLEMIDRKHDLPVSRQAAVLGISRGSVYYLPRAVSDADLALMRRIDELHLDYPFAGSRMLQGLLKQEGHQVGRLHVATLMRKMGIEAALPAAQHLEAGARPQGVPISLAQAGGDAAEPGPPLGDASIACRARGRWISPTSRWRGASSIWRP